MFYLISNVLLLVIESFEENKIKHSELCVQFNKINDSIDSQGIRLTLI